MSATHDEPPKAPLSVRTSATLSILLFWPMFLVGAASMAACLILPAWLEYQATSRLVARTERRNADLTREVHARDLQIAHHKLDPEYNERFVREEFNVQRPDRVTIVLDPPADESSGHGAGGGPRAAGKSSAAGSADDGSPAESAGSKPSQADELAAMVETAARRNPLVSLFALPQTRPPVMVLSAILLLGSLLLLRGPKTT